MKDPHRPTSELCGNKNFRMEKCYLLRLTLSSPEGEQTTWTAGHGSAEAVLEKWEAENAAMARNLVSHELMTPKKEDEVYPYLQPKGPRVQVEDRNLKGCARDLGRRMLG